MTTKPKIASDVDFMRGLPALLLFVVLVIPFLTVSFGDPVGFPKDASVTAAIGYAMFNISGDFVGIEAEGMLAAFEIIDLVLVAALVAAVMLGRRDEAESAMRALTDGGHTLKDSGRDLLSGEEGDD